MKKTFKELEVGDKLYCITNNGNLFVTMPIIEIDKTSHSYIVFVGEYPEQKITIHNTYNTCVLSNGLFISTNIREILERADYYTTTSAHFSELKELDHYKEELINLKRQIEEAETYYMEHKETLEQILKSYESND